MITGTEFHSQDQLDVISDWQMGKIRCMCRCFMVPLVKMEKGDVSNVTHHPISDTYYNLHHVISLI
jgi:hypothetical protein